MEEKLNIATLQGEGLSARVWKLQRNQVDGAYHEAV